MDHTWKKWVPLRKISRTWKNDSHLVKWITLGEMGHTWKKKIGHTNKKGSNMEKGVTP